MNTFNILDPAACGKKIDRIARVGKALQNDIHVVAVSTLAHIRDHGDFTLAIRLLNALPNGQRVKALGNWYSVLSGGAAKFSYDNVNGSWTCKLAKDRNPEQFNIEKAMEVSYADLVPEKGYKTLTFAGFTAMLKRKANEDGLNADGSPKVTPELRSVCADLYTRFKKVLDESKADEPVVALDDLIKA